MKCKHCGKKALGKINSISLPLCVDCLKSYVEKKLAPIKRSRVVFIIDEGRLNVIKRFLNIENTKFYMLSEKYPRLRALDVVEELLLFDRDQIVSDLLLEELVAIVLYLLYLGDVARLMEFVRKVSGKSITLPFGSFLREDLEYIIGAYNLGDKVSLDLWDEDVLAIIKALKYLDSRMRGSLYRFWMGLVRKHPLLFGS